MAANGAEVDRETFCCSVCLDLLKDPVTIPCGHSYCMSCVNTHWDGEVGKQSYSCPQCRQNFTQRPVLVKNTMLAVLMEGLKKSGPPAAPLPPSAAPGEVFCDLCSGREVKAVKSCLRCQVSYCKEHLQPHYVVAALKKHKLVVPTENLQENMCSRHDEMMKMFCRTDQQCICYLCSVDQHKGHHTVTAAAERAEKQRELQAFQQNILQKIKLKEEDVERLQGRLTCVTKVADFAMEDSERKIKVLTRLLEKRMSEVKQEVRSQQKTEEHRVNELQDKVQQELTELRRKLTELDTTLSHTEDHMLLLNTSASVCKGTDEPELPDSPNIIEAPLPFHDIVTTAVTDLKFKVQYRRKTVPRDEFVQYACNLTLDRDTAHNSVFVWDTNKSAQFDLTQQTYSKHPDRFTQCRQILCNEPLTGRCYFELRLAYCKKVTIALTYKDIERNAPVAKSGFGKTKSSWALVLYGELHKIKHNNTAVNVELEKPTEDVGILLDHNAGTVAFYRMNRPPCLIHEVCTEFTQPLYLGIGFEEEGDQVEIWNPQTQSFIFMEG